MIFLWNVFITFYFCLLFDLALMVTFPSSVKIWINLNHVQLLVIWIWKRFTFKQLLICLQLIYGLSETIIRIMHNKIYFFLKKYSICSLYILRISVNTLLISLFDIVNNLHLLATPGVSPNMAIGRVKCNNASIYISSTISLLTEFYVTAGVAR
jgi:hypothetical protein